MPRNFNKYQYETSPRKIEPEYAPKKNNYKGKKSTAKKNTTKKTTNNKAKVNVKETKKAKSKKELEDRKKRREVLTYLGIGFAILFAFCYRNAQIDESFEKVQSYKKELSAIEKENSQLEVAIESSVNLSNIEQQAKELLGMQRLNSKQITYINIEKDDHIETAAENVVIKEESQFQKIINTIKSLFK